MRIRRSLIVVGLVAVLGVGLLAGRALEEMGTPDSTGDPASTSSYTLEDIYNRLNTGAPGTPGAFTEPISGPGTGTMNTLEEIMAKAGTACTQCNPPGTLVGTRWCDNGDGTVTDMTTGLVWLKKADWGGIKPWRNNSLDCGCGGASYPCYDDAHARAGLLYAGATGAGLSDGSDVGDWRLPTKTELEGLTEGTEGVLSSSQRAFTGVQPTNYWSSTTSTSVTTFIAWTVDMLDALVISGGKCDSYYVWPVRGP